MKEFLYRQHLVTAGILTFWRGRDNFQLLALCYWGMKPSVGGYSFTWWCSNVFPHGVYGGGILVKDFLY